MNNHGHIFRVLDVFKTCGVEEIIVMWVHVFRAQVVLMIPDAQEVILINISGSGLQGSRFI